MVLLWGGCYHGELICDNQNQQNSYTPSETPLISGGGGRGVMLQKYSQAFPDQFFWCLGVEVLRIWIPKEGPT